MSIAIDIKFMLGKITYTGSDELRRSREENRQDVFAIYPDSLNDIFMKSQ